MLSQQTLVSIGLPVFNGEATIEQTLSSLLKQSHQNLEIIVSDNCSTDATVAICEKYQRIDDRIKIHRQPTNQGAIKNFKSTLADALGKYFMWAAADDSWNEKFVQCAVDQLEADASLIGVNIAPKNLPTVASVLDGYLGFEEDSVNERLASFLQLMPDSNSRFYSLYRTQVLKGLAYPSDHAYAWDWIVVVELLKHGKLRVIYSEEAGFTKTYGGASVSRYNVLRFIAEPLDYLRPMVHFSRSIPFEVRHHKYKKMIYLEIYFCLKLWYQCFLFLKDSVLKK